MRKKIDFQPSFPAEFGRRINKEYVKYKEKYACISQLLDDNPAILDAFHADLAEWGSEAGRESTFSSEQFLRMSVVKTIEGLTYRDTIIRISDSSVLRNFIRIFSSEMMNYAEFQMAMKNISAATWEKINALFLKYSRKKGTVTGKRLRMDSTVCESNIHYPTDASLLWDSFRVASRTVRQCVAADSTLGRGNRFHDRKIKRVYTFIATHSGRQTARRAVRRSMKALIGKVAWICGEARQFCGNAKKVGSISGEAMGLIGHLELMLPLMEQVVSCARRATAGETVPASERIFSIFEPHTELLKRGKAHKPVEFGHMIALGQTGEKFISYYRVEEHSQHDIYLGDDALRNHKEMFGGYPSEYAADKNFYGGPEHSAKWRERIQTYSVGKKGRRNENETRREHGFMFRLLQQFRAGSEGSISFLKRMFGLCRCLNRGFNSFASAIGNIVFCHNLILATRL